MRDAVGGARIVTFVESRIRTSVRVLSGQEEARLMFAGALGGLARVDSVIVAFDVGGGSTEVVCGKRMPEGRMDLDYFESFDIGSVRLTERNPFSDPPREPELRVTRAAAVAGLASVRVRAHSHPPIGTAGTVTTLAAVSLGIAAYDASRVHGYTMSVAELERVVGMLAAIPLVERKNIPGMHPGRADIIVAGGIIVLAVLQQLEATAVQVSDRGLRWGLAEELATSPP
jgi:exopolyphosphatase/guanosine-5'-triphosphate,3'-diphosphate pyrophosphatase